MKTKLAIVAFILISSSGCMTTTNSYTRDIVYRDGSYYSPADEQNGDYYYEPEPDYSSYYDDAYFYGFNSGYYGRYDSYRCRFSYHHDRYCNNGWGGAYLNFGGLSIIFGGSNYYSYGYGYPGYGYHGGGYPYYGWHSPRPRPHNRDPIPMPKPRRPGNPDPDYGFNGAGISVPGEPVRRPVKPGAIDQNPVERFVDLQDQDQVDPNPYTRVREPRPNVRPEIWRNAVDDENAQTGNVEPDLLIGQEDPVVTEKPVRDNRRPQPYPRDGGSGRNRRQAPVVDSADSDAAPVERNRRERSSPRNEPRQIERTERSERSSERPARTFRREGNGNEAN